MPTTLIRLATNIHAMTTSTQTEAISATRNALRHRRPPRVAPGPPSFNGATTPSGAPRREAPEDGATSPRPQNAGQSFRHRLDPRDGFAHGLQAPGLRLEEPLG